MSDDVEYADYSAGNEHESLNELHQDDNAVAEHDSQFGVYDNEHHQAEATDFTQFHQEQVHAPAYDATSTDFVNYSNESSVDDVTHIAEGSEHDFNAESSSLDALQARFDSAFAEGTEYHGHAGGAELGPASS